MRLAAADGALPSPRPRQYLTVRLVTESGGTVVRSYSLAGPLSAPDYRVSVKREPDGIASGHLHATTAPGQTIEAAAPLGTFTLAPGSDPVALVSV